MGETRHSSLPILAWEEGSIICIVDYFISFLYIVSPFV